MNRSMAASMAASASGAWTVPRSAAGVDLIRLIRQRRSLAVARLERGVPLVRFATTGRPGAALSERPGLGGGAPLWVAGGAVVVHVAHRTHGIEVGGNAAISGFELGLRARDADERLFGARPARERDQRDGAFPGGDRRSGVDRRERYRKSRHNRWNRNAGAWRGPGNRTSPASRSARPRRRNIRRHPGDADRHLRARRARPRHAIARSTLSGA
jgi:hypothetical protein